MTGARKMLLATILSMGLAACAQTDSRALSKSALANTGDNVTWQSLNDEVSGVKASQLTDLINLDDIAHMSSFIEEALQHNANLQQTLITLQKAQVAIDSTASQRNINVDAGASATKNKQSDTNYTSSLNVSWELDVWQRISDGITAASLNADSAKASYQSARDTLVANVIRRYIDILSQQHLLSIEKARLEELENNEAVILTRYRTGLGDLDDLDAAMTRRLLCLPPATSLRINSRAFKKGLMIT